MSEKTNEESADDVSSDRNTDLQTTAVSSNYKVLGQFDNGSGVGVLGQNDASSGTPIGVQGAVPSTASGFGFYTEDKVKFGGPIDSPNGLALTVDNTRVINYDSEGTDHDGNSAAGSIVAGHSSNTVQSDIVGATISGGGSGASDAANVVNDHYATIGGGKQNTAGIDDGNHVLESYQTIGGGRENTATDGIATVSGGGDNEATEFAATVCGGSQHSASGRYSIIAGGRDNKSSEKYDTVGGGYRNKTSVFQAGDPEDYTSGYNSVLGGELNEAEGGHAAVGGGQNNHARAEAATVPGGAKNEAWGAYSLAAGRRGEANHDGSFVWADSTDANVTSTGNDQFLVEASGGTGVGTNDPATTFHVKDSVAESGSDNLGRHVAAIENTSTSSSPSPDVLGLEMSNTTDPGQFNSYISFMDSSGTIGNIQGDGNGGMEFVGSLADFAEFFPKANPETEFADGTVVGLRDGEVVSLARESNPDTVLVVSTSPLVTGNRPIDEADREKFIKLSLVGQVPVRVSESVDHGDVLVANLDDGTALARADCEEASRPVVGMALEASTAGDEVLTLVGGPGLAITRATQQAASEPMQERSSDTNARLPEQTARIDVLETENKHLREELAEKDECIDCQADRIDDLEEANEQLSERLASMEERLATIEANQTSPAPADD